MSERYTPRRGLRRTEAAIYLGISATKLDELVQSGRMPAGFVVDGCRIWDIRDLDLAFDALKAGAAPVGPRRRRAEVLEEFDRL